jgi:hypothetical protein
MVDRVVAHVDAAAAPVRYRRLRRAIAEIRSLAIRSGADDLEEFLTAEDTVLATMAAAVNVVEAAGVHVDRADDRAGHLRRAVHWNRYAHGPLNALHRRCAADIRRGSLLLAGRSL